MSIGFDPLVSSAFFSVGLIPHAVRSGAVRELPQPSSCAGPSVTVIVALYREQWDDIDMTVESLLHQTYDRQLFDVLLAIEARDAGIRPHVEAAVRKLRAGGIEASLVVSDAGRRLKAYALNRSIERARGEICAFYDASDDIEATQIERAALLMREKSYDAVQATVLRKGRSILSEFLFVDTAFWFRQYIPFVLSIAKGMPLSGEGLFVRTDVLREVGGFPEVLTEDAYLGLILTERNKRFGLVASVITEKAPRHMRSHFVQRLRWNRGYLTCLRRLMRSTLPLKRKLALSLPFLTPITCSLAFLGWMLIAGQWLVETARGVPIPDVTYSLVSHPVYAGVVNSWAMLLFVLGIPLCVASYIRTLWSLDMKRSLPLVLLLPGYWTFIGFAATCSFFKSTRTWGKTER